MQDAQRQFRLQQQRMERQMSVPPFRHTVTASAVGRMVGGLTLPLPGGHAVRVRFLDTDSR